MQCLGKILLCPYSFEYCLSSPSLQLNSLLVISAWTHHCNLKVTIVLFFFFFYYSPFPAVIVYESMPYINNMPPTHSSCFYGSPITLPIVQVQNFLTFKSALLILLSCSSGVSCTLSSSWF